MEKKLLRVREFLEKNKDRGYWPQKDDTIRNLMHQLKTKGNEFEKAFLKIDKHVYINEEEFWKAVKKKALSQSLLKTPLAANLNTYQGEE